jgi:hypothetical protein
MKRCQDNLDRCLTRQFRCANGLRGEQFRREILNHRPVTLIQTA